MDLERASIKQSLLKKKNVLIRNWDVILVLAASLILLFYNLKSWRMMSVEEWHFYRDFTTNWFSSHRIHSFFIPSYLLTYFVPSRDFLVLRYFTASITGLGVVIYHLAIRKASGSKLVGLTAVSLVLTDAWLLWYGRHFAWFWSATTLTALAFLLYFWRNDRSLIPNSVVAAVSILNLSQAVFFAFPFLASEIYCLKDRISWKELTIAMAIFLLLIVPSIQIFLEKQEGHLAEKIEHGENKSEIINAEIDVNTDIYNGDSFKIVFNPIQTFDKLKKRAGKPTRGLYTYNWSSKEDNYYTLLALAIILFPIYLWYFSEWENRIFFGLGSLGAFLFFIIFPFVADETYFWAMMLFFYPLPAYGLIKSNWVHVKVISLVLISALVISQGSLAYDKVLDYNQKEEFNNEFMEKVEGKNIYISERAYGMLKNYDNKIPEKFNYTKINCKSKEIFEKLNAKKSIIPKSEANSLNKSYILTSDACRLDKTVESNIKWYKLYKRDRENKQ